MPRHKKGTKHIFKSLIYNDFYIFVETMNNSLQFSIDDDSGRTVVKVVDKQTDEVLRQIPSEEMLDIARALGKLKGLLVEQKV